MRKRIVTILILIIISHCQISTIAAQPAFLTTSINFTRQPYLQQPTAHSIILRWRTIMPQTVRVIYGESLQNQTSQTVEVSAVTEHELLLSGLKPDTKYYYTLKLAEKTVAGGDSSHYFRTAPATGSTRKIRAWVMGDSGTAKPPQHAVRKAFLKLNGNNPLDFILFLGDNAYTRGTDREYQNALFDVYTDEITHWPSWSTYGNHDSYSGDGLKQQGAYFDAFSLPKNGEAGGIASGTEAYYSFDYGNAHFISLDSMANDRSSTGTQLNWLRKDLKSAKQRWIIAFFHHPPYTKGSHDSDSAHDSKGRMQDMRQNALPILEENGVDLVLSGHSHNYERSFLINGHYGNSRTFDTKTMLLDGDNGQTNGDGAYYKKSTKIKTPHSGTVYVVCGSSGGRHGNMHGLNYPCMIESTKTNGSLLLEIEDQQLDVQFITMDGQILDSFRIQKSATNK